jgi:hypothetical protein
MLPPSSGPKIEPNKKQGEVGGELNLSFDPEGEATGSSEMLDCLTNHSNRRQQINLHDFALNSF